MIDTYTDEDARRMATSEGWDEATLTYFRNHYAWRGGAFLGSL